MTGSFTSSRRLFLALALLIVTAGCAVALKEVYDREQLMLNELLNQTRRNAQSINAARIMALAGAEEDIHNPAYQRLKRQLILLRETDLSYRFMYLMGRRDDGTFFFFVDSEPETSEDYSPPGQAYLEASEEEVYVFGHAREWVGGPETDRWGTWVSAYVPIVDPVTSKVIALFGVDVSVEDWDLTRWTAAWRPLIGTLILLVLLGAGAAVLGWRESREDVQHPILENAELILVIAMGLTLSILLAIGEQERGRNVIRQAFAQLADTDVHHVGRHMSYLRDFHLNGLVRFIEASGEVTPEEFRRYVEPLGLDPVVRAWGWAPAVKHADLAEFEAQTRAVWLTDFMIWERDPAGNRIPTPYRPVHYPIVFVEPLAINREAVGFDQLSEVVRAEAMERAIHTRLPSATAPIPLIIPGSEGDFLACYQPVYRCGDAAAELPMGLITIVLDTDALLYRLYGRTQVHADVFLLRSDDEPVLLSSYCDRADDDRDLNVIRPIMIFGEVMLVKAHPSAEFLNGHPNGGGRRALFTGLLLTAAVAFVVGIPARRRAQLSREVTERTQELQASEAKYRLLIEHQSDYLAKLDADGRIVFASPSLCRVLGRSDEEVVGKPFHVFLHPDNKSSVLRDYESLVKPPHQMYSEQRVKANAGWRWLAWQNDALLDESGQIDAVIGVGRDITDQKEAELALQRRLRYEQLLGQVSTAAVKTVDVPAFLHQALHILGEGLDVSRAYILEYRPETRTLDNTCEWCAEGIFSVQHEMRNVPEALFGDWLKILHSGEYLIVRDVHDVPNEELRAMLISQQILSLEGVPLFVDGKPYGFLGFDECRERRAWPDEDMGLIRTIALVISGVIERQRAADALRSGEEKYRRLTESMRDVVWVLDAATLRFTYVSPSVYSLRGWTAEEVMAEPMDAAMNADQAQRVREEIRSRSEELKAGLLSSDNYFINEVEQPCKDGTMVWTEVITHFSINTQTGRIEIHGVTRDITERRRSEAQLREHIEELQRWHSVTVGREGRILELKREVNELLARLGISPRYKYTSG